MIKQPRRAAGPACWPLGRMQVLTPCRPVPPSPPQPGPWRRRKSINRAGPGFGYGFIVAYAFCLSFFMLLCGLVLDCFRPKLASLSKDINWTAFNTSNSEESREGGGRAGFGPHAHPLPPPLPCRSLSSALQPRSSGTTTTTPP